MCPTVEELLAFAQQNDDERATWPDPLSRSFEEIRRHLEAGCESCRHRLTQIRKLLSAVWDPCLIDPPIWLRRQAQALYRHHRQLQPSAEERATLAVLVVDSFAEGRLLGLRGTWPMSRQFLYRAGDYDVDLSVDYIEAKDAVDIIGQSMPITNDLRSVAHATVELVKASTLAHITQANVFGEFILDGVQEGVYDLRIRLKDQAIYIPDLPAIVRSFGQKTTREGRES
ncbi:MAG TPA: hypothetical protein VNM72_13655 [Blastocatellia bacterium]|nr:hypothetical protein [Blastocatellia bacterium]